MFNIFIFVKMDLYLCNESEDHCIQHQETGALFPQKLL